MRKGITTWLTIFLSVAVGLILLVVIWNSAGASRLLSEGAGTTGSAVDLGNAIRSVYQCAEESDDPEEDCKEFVNISMPQAVKNTLLPEGTWYDPKWLIYYSGTNHKKGDIVPIDKGEDLIKGVMHVLNDKCPDGICYGMVVMSNNDKIPLEKEILNKLEPFWLLSPCGAEVKVYYKDGKIKICRFRKLGEEDGFKSEFNFCWNPDSSFLDASYTWPGHQSDGWKCPSGHPGW